MVIFEVLQLKQPLIATSDWEKNKHEENKRSFKLSNTLA